MVIKKDNTREAYDRQKMMIGIKKACEKRPISAEQLEQIQSEIEERMINLGVKEVKSSWIGEEVMKCLKELDKVAYVRFASVYRQFKDVNEFMDEIKGLFDKQPKKQK